MKGGRQNARGCRILEITKIKGYRDIEPWLEKAKAAYPDEYPYLTDGRDGFSLDTVLAEVENQYAAWKAAKE